MVHPDDTHLLHDWYIYGPRDSVIFELVNALAHKGLRIQEIEKLIEASLRAKLTEQTGTTAAISPAGPP